MKINIYINLTINLIYNTVCLKEATSKKFKVKSGMCESC